jgi:hypothetical protein
LAINIVTAAANAFNICRELGGGGGFKNYYNRLAVEVEPRYKESEKVGTPRRPIRNPFNRCNW